MKGPYSPRRGSKKPARRKLAKQFGNERSSRDLAIAYAVQNRTWSGLFGGKYSINSDGCYEWSGNLNRNGYGVKKILHHEVKGQFYEVLAHRLAFALKNGVESLPKGSSRLGYSDGVIDHTCNNKKCINPEHLRVLENYENMTRKDGPFYG